MKTLQTEIISERESSKKTVLNLQNEQKAMADRMEMQKKHLTTQYEQCSARVNDLLNALSRQKDLTEEQARALERLTKEHQDALESIRKLEDAARSTTALKEELSQAQDAAKTQAAKLKELLEQI